MHDLRLELLYILDDLSMSMHGTSVLTPIGNEEDTFKYIFQEVKSIKSFTNELKNYQLTKKN